MVMPGMIVIQEEFNKSLTTLAMKKTRKRSEVVFTFMGITVPVSDDFYFPSGNTLSATDVEKYQQALRENEVFKKFL